MIDKPAIVDLVIPQPDDRGALYEVLRTDRPDMVPPGVEIKQNYVVRSSTRGTVRAYHRHKVLWDFFHIIKGSAKFVVWAPLHECGDFGAPECERLVVTLSERKPQLLVVPPRYFHGWVALEDDTILLSSGSECYDRTNPDEERIPPDYYGLEIWDVKFR